MLLLAHNERATLILETSDGPIEVRLSRLNGDQARIGIDAPQNVRIIRQETDAPPPEPCAAEEHFVDDDDWWLHPDEEKMWSQEHDDALSALTADP